MNTPCPTGYVWVRWIPWDSPEASARTDLPWSTNAQGHRGKWVLANPTERAWCEPASVLGPVNVPPFTPGVPVPRADSPSAVTRPSGVSVTTPARGPVVQRPPGVDVRAPARGQAVPRPGPVDVTAPPSPFTPYPEVVPRPTFPVPTPTPPFEPIPPPTPTRPTPEDVLAPTPMPTMEKLDVLETLLRLTLLTSPAWGAVLLARAQGRRR